VDYWTRCLDRELPHPRWWSQGVTPRTLFSSCCGGDYPLWILGDIHVSWTCSPNRWWSESQWGCQKVPFYLFILRKKGTFLWRVVNHNKSWHQVPLDVQL
jgi:hypothetical protein